MSDFEAIGRRIPLEEIDEHIEQVRRSLNRAQNASGGQTITEPKIEAILNILVELTSEVRRIRDATGTASTVDD